MYIGVVCVLWDTFSAKTMLSACDLPLTLVGPRGTVRYRSTQVHPEPSGSPPSPSPQGAEVQQCAPSELLRLTEAAVSSVKRELARRTSLSGASTIDDVGSESVAKLATTKTLHVCQSIMSLI